MTVLRCQPQPPRLPYWTVSNTTLFPLIYRVTSNLLFSDSFFCWHNNLFNPLHSDSTFISTTICLLCVRYNASEIKKFTNFCDMVPWRLSNKACYIRESEKKIQSEEIYLSSIYLNSHNFFFFWFQSGNSGGQGEQLRNDYDYHVKLWTVEKRVCTYTCYMTCFQKCL